LIQVERQRATIGAALALWLLALAASSAYADHERFIVGEMRNADPSAPVTTSTSGACIPSHNRERLECYFTSFGLWKTQTEEEAQKQYEDAVKELAKDPTKQMQQLKDSFCSEKKMLAPDPIRLKYSPSARTFFTSIKAFCDRPTRDLALAIFKTLIDIDAKKCRIAVTDWRSTLLRQTDRWVENNGPSGLCGIIKVFTLVPHDLKKMSDPTGPVLWTLHEKTVTTHSVDDKPCAKSPFKIEEGAITLTWDAPSKDTDCGEFQSAVPSNACSIPARNRNS
jgi:hypothetical protein